MIKKNKLVYGCSGVLAGYIVFMLIIDYMSKPNNISIALKPIESLQGYFFAFAFGGGTLGWILGCLLLIGFLALFYFFGIWIYNIKQKH